MIHFREHFGLCSQAKEGDVISTTSSISTYRLLCAESPLFCQECAGYDDERTDSDRYAELRALVEAWISTHTGLPFANEAWQALFDWRHR